MKFVILYYPIHTIKHSLQWEANNDDAQAFYETQRFIILFTWAYNRPLSSVRGVWSKSTSPISLISILMLLYNDQRNAQVFNKLIYLFTSALHVSVFLLAHLQRQVYNFGSGSSLLGMVSALGRWNHTQTPCETYLNAVYVITIRITTSTTHVDPSSTGSTKMKLVFYASVRNLPSCPTGYPDILPTSRATPYQPPANSTHSHILQVSFIFASSCYTISSLQDCKYNLCSLT
jgi:hypothetical protein